MLEKVQSEKDLLYDDSGLGLRELLLGLPLDDGHQSTFGLVFEDHIHVVLVLVELK